jgi:hypothetical protein
MAAPADPSEPLEQQYENARPHDLRRTPVAPATPMRGVSR